MIGSLRASARLASLVAHTSTHLRRLPRESRDAPLVLGRAQGWARQVISCVGIRVIRTGAPPSGPVMLVANHRSYIDIPVVLSEMPCTFLAKREIASWPLFGAAAARIHAVFVDRSCPRSRTTARADVVQRLRSGLSVAVFPEGTTSREPGVRPFFPGLFEEARRHDFAVCPVAITYPDPDDAWVEDAPFVQHFLDRFRKPWTEVYVSFGVAVRPGEVPDLREHAREWIRSALEAHGPGVAPAVSAQAVPT